MTGELRYIIFVEVVTDVTLVPEGMPSPETAMPWEMPVVSLSVTIDVVVDAIVL